MKLDVDDRFCWQGALENMRFGCTLDLEFFEKEGLTARRLKQVHGATIIDDAHYEGDQQEGDGLVTEREGVAVIARTADCVPVHVTDGTKMAVVHAGWRGVKAGVVKALADHFDMTQTHVFIGPGIAQSAYEVDADMYEPWLKDNPELQPYFFKFSANSSKRLFDLKGLIRRQLLDLGAPEQQLILIPICTFQSGGLPSYRRDGKNAGQIYNYCYKLAPATPEPI